MIIVISIRIRLITPLGTILLYYIIASRSSTLSFVLNLCNEINSIVIKASIPLQDSLITLSLLFSTYIVNRTTRRITPRYTKAKSNFFSFFLRRDVYLLNRCALLGRRYSLLSRDILFSAPIIYNPPSIRVRETFLSPYIVPPPFTRLVSSRNKRPLLPKKNISEKRSKIGR